MFHGALILLRTMTSAEIGYPAQVQIPLDQWFVTVSSESFNNLRRQINHRFSIRAWQAYLLSSYDWITEWWLFISIRYCLNNHSPAAVPWLCASSRDAISVLVQESIANLRLVFWKSAVMSFKAVSCLIMNSLILEDASSSTLCLPFYPRTRITGF